MRGKIFIVSFLFVLIGCRESSPVETSNFKEAPNYYPLTKGSNWFYSIDTSDSKGESFARVGIRKSTIAGYDTFNGKSYALQIDSIVSQLRNSSDTLLLRKDELGLYIAFRQTNIANILTLPAEIKLLPYPLETSTNWTIYDTTVYLGTIPIARINIKGRLVAFENVQVPAGNFYCAKVEASASGFIINPQNPLQPYQFSFPGTFWLNKETGMIKTVASLPLAQLLQGNFNFALLDSLRVIRQELLSFKVN